MAEKIFQLTRSGLFAVPVDEAEPQPVREWVETAEGKRTPTGPQLRDKDGVPVWQLAHKCVHDRLRPRCA